MTTNTASRLTECYRALDAIGVDFTPENVEKLRALSDHYYSDDMTASAEAIAHDGSWDEWQRCEVFWDVWDVVARDYHRKVCDAIEKAHGLTAAYAFVKGFGFSERRDVVDRLDRQARTDGYGPLYVEVDSAGVGTYYARKA